MSDVLLYAALILAILGLGASTMGARVARIVPGVSWLALIAGFGLQAAGMVSDLRGALGTALFAGLAVVLGGTTQSRCDGLSGAAAVVVVGSVVALLSAPASEVMAPGHLILVSAAFAALTALVAGLVGAASSRASDSPAGLALAAGGAVGGGALAGFLRSSLPQSGYSVPLRTSAGDTVFWQLPGVEGLPDGLRLSAVLDIPAMPWVIGAAIALSVVVAFAEIAGRRREAVVGWVLVGACVAGALGVLHVASTEARLPGTQRYEDTARQFLKDAKANEALLERGAFTGGDADLVIARADMAPEFFGYGLAGLLALIVLSRRFGPFARREEETEETDAGALLASELVQRDTFVRAASFGWLAVFAAGLIHFGYFGVAWLGSASEWSAIGAMLVVTGLLVGTFDRRRTTAAVAARAAAPGLGAAVVFLVLGLAWSFGTPFALSINVY
jgi:hypothetical protein